MEENRLSGAQTNDPVDGDTFQIRSDRFVVRVEHERREVFTPSELADLVIAAGNRKLIVFIPMDEAYADPTIEMANESDIGLAYITPLGVVRAASSATERIEAAGLMMRDS